MLVKYFDSALVAAAVDTEAIADEWTKLKSMVYGFNNWKDLLQRASWMEINRRCKEDCENMLLLLDLIMTLPASTAAVERGFNLMKLIKPEHRASLGAVALNDLMLVKAESSDIPDFDPARAVEMWLTGGQRTRRPNLMEDSDQADSDRDHSDSDHNSDSEEDLADYDVAEAL